MTYETKRAPLAKIVGAGLVATLLAVLVITMIAAGSLNKVSSNEWGCLYGGGLTEDRGLKQVIAPGQSGGFTVADSLITIPAGDRIYAIDNDPSTADFGGQPIVVPARGSAESGNGIVPVVVPVQARFTINERACELYQNYLKGKGDIDWNGNRTKEDDKGNKSPDPGAWPKFLNLQMNQVLTTSIRSQLSIGSPSYVDLYQDFTKYPTYQTNVSNALTASLESSLGGTFFCGPSYQFDGNADGKVESCPPIEIVIKEIKPQNPVFLENLQTIVANQEQQTVVESEKDKAIAQAKADKERALAQTAADQETALARTAAEKEKALAATAADEETRLAKVDADRAVRLAEAVADQEIAVAFYAVAQSETANELVRKQTETAFCERLAVIGVNCADYFKYQNYNPSVVLADSGATPLINLNDR